MEKVSTIFSELLHFVKTILVYCDILREIKAKREHIRCKENEMEKFINVLQALSIERNKMVADLVAIRQQHANGHMEKTQIENLLHETNMRLVGHQSIRCG